MFCMYCGKPVMAEHKFCPACGRQIVNIENRPILPEQTDAQPPVCEIRPVRKGTLRIPALVLTVMCVVGLALFFLFPESEAPAVPSSSNGPFTNENGYLYFNEMLYTGPDELTVPETIGELTVTNLGECCFEDCDSLTSIKLPETLRYVESWAFYDCDRLRGIEIPDGVLYIGKEAFYGCANLEAISIPASIETINFTAFDNCVSLKYVFFAGTKAQWNQLYHGCEDSTAMVYCSDGKVPLQKFG